MDWQTVGVSALTSFITVVLLLATNAAINLMLRRRTRAIENALAREAVRRSEAPADPDRDGQAVRRRARVTEAHVSQPRKRS